MQNHTEGPFRCGVVTRAKSSKKKIAPVVTSKIKIECLVFLIFTALKRKTVALHYN